MDPLCEDLHTFLGTSRAYLDKHLSVRNLLRTKLVGEKKHTHIAVASTPRKSYGFQDDETGVTESSRITTLCVHSRTFSTITLLSNLQCSF